MARKQLGAPPVAPLEAATKGYVDTAIAAFEPAESGGGGLTRSYSFVTANGTLLSTATSSEEVQVRVSITPDATGDNENGGIAGIVALLNFNGANGSTAITDSSYVGQNWTVNGSASLSTDQFKFGTASLALNGGGYISAPAIMATLLSETVVPNITTGGQMVPNYDVAMHVYPTSLPSPGNTAMIYDGRPSGTGNGFTVYLKNTGGTTNVCIAHNGTEFTNTAPVTVTANVWYWVAFKTTYNGGLQFVVNTTNQYNTSFQGVNFLYPSDQAPNLGKSTGGFIGYIDDFRITTQAKVTGPSYDYTGYLATMSGGGFLRSSLTTIPTAALAPPRLSRIRLPNPASGIGSYTVYNAYKESSRPIVVTSPNMAVFNYTNAVASTTTPFSSGRYFRIPSNTYVTFVTDGTAWYGSSNEYTVAVPGDDLPASNRFLRSDGTWSQITYSSLGTYSSPNTTYVYAPTPFNGVDPSKWDVIFLSNLNADVTSMTTGWTNYPTLGKQLVVIVTDNGTSRSITWGTQWVAGSGSNATLLANTVVGKRHLMVFIYGPYGKFTCTYCDTAGQ